MAYDVEEANSILSSLKPTGAKTTATFDNLPYGVKSSWKMAEMDLKANEHFEHRYELAGQKFDLPPALLAAIASRESRAGEGLDKHGEGDSGNAVGIMQIDQNWHDPVPIGKDFGSQGHINQAASILDWFRDEAADAHPKWSAAQKLQAGVAAYNGGPEVFDHAFKDMDDYTDYGDYSNDVIARAQYYAFHTDLFA